MKSKRATLLILAAFVAVPPVYAQTSNIEPGNKKTAKPAATDAQHLPGMKFEKGIKNLLFGWTDIPRSIVDVSSETRNPILGLTAGTLKGAGKAFPRTLSGAADIVLSPIGECAGPHPQDAGGDSSR